MSELDVQIAFVGLNAHSIVPPLAPGGVRGMGVYPAHFILVSPRERLLAEWRRYHLAIVSRWLVPKVRAVLGSRQAPAGAEGSGPPAAGPKVVRVKKLNSDATVACIERLGIRYLVNAGAGIFRSPLVDLPDLVIVNAHAGKLPEYRNMNVVEWALYNGEPVVGTVHRIDGGIDTGPTLLARPLDLDASASVEEARAEAFDQVARLVGEAVVAHAAGEIAPVPQPPGGRRWYVMHSAFARALDAVHGCKRARQRARTLTE